MKRIADLVAEHPFFEELSPENRELISGCAKHGVFKPGEYLIHEGAVADYFYLIQSGLVSIEIHEPAGGSAVIQTATDGDVVGVAWLFDPPRWNFDVRAIETTRVLHFDTGCLKRKCEDDPRFGYLIMEKFSQLLMERLHSTRVRLLDLYGYGKSS
ncbi:MAG: cyclic nucleotide-binding domain-containing protein [Gemmatimonadota bacterium]|jgi:CRP-like cAMP-binding protein